MTLGRLATSALRRFAASQSGSVAVTFALSVVPLLLASGMAIDYVRFATARTDLQSALDAGALAAAAAADLSNSERIVAANTTFATNLTTGTIKEADVARSFTVSNGKVVASASFDLPTSLMQLAGIADMAVSVATEVSIPGKQKAEIALVLDYSNSMTEVLGGQVKYVAMKNAAKKLVSDLAAANPKNIKVGLVPFSHQVWVTLPKQDVLNQTGTGTWTGCTQDRKYPYNLTDDAPTSDPASKWGQPNSTLHASWGCGAYVPNNLVVRPLTDDFTVVNAKLDAMKPYAWTHIALGAEFGFRLLSPNEPFGQAASYADTTTKKFMVLLTDGEQTEPAFGPGTVRSVTQGEKNLTAICTNAKAKGITIITIAYNIDDTATVNRLRDCTSDPNKDFFDIGTDNQVAGAFEEIKKQITARVRIGK
ncbi:MAG: VWA domain-containing protein [Rhizobiales bacterium]|nr:VWA domain-containing protein [Hyphomicrobiales bacterium]